MRSLLLTFGFIAIYLAGSCKACGEAGYKPLDNAYQYMDDMYNFVKKHGDKPGWETVLKEAVVNNVFVQEGAWFATRVALTYSNVKDFDAAFDENEGNFTCPRQSCRYDIALIGDVDISVECKSYANPTEIPKNQFKNYFDKIASLDNLLYVFNGKKLEGGTDTPIEKAKKGIQRKLFKDGALTPYGEEVFEIIWENSDLKNELFKGVDFNNIDPNVPKQESLIIFKALLSNISSVYYRFIITK